MRRKQPALIITFSSTADAMAVEKHCGEHRLPGRLIPTPGEITAGCGLAWKAPPGDAERLFAALEAMDIRWEATAVLEMWSA